MRLTPAPRIRTLPRPARLAAAGAAIGLVAILAGASLGPSFAAGAAPPAVLKAAPAYVVDTAASRLSFRAGLGGGVFDGVFKKWDASLQIDPRRPEASRAILRVDASSLVTGDPVRDALLRGPAWLAARRIPRAEFVVTRITRTGPDRYAVAGALDLKGVRRPISADVVLETGRSGFTAVAVAALDPSQFGIGPPTASGAPPRRIEVRLRLAARPGP